MKKTQNPDKGLAGLLSMAASQKRRLLLSIFFNFAGQALGLIPFVLVGLLVGKMAENQGNLDSHGIFRLVLAGFVAVLLKYLCTGIATLLSHTAAYEILLDLRLRLSEKLATLPLGYFTARTTGEIQKVILEDVEQMEVFIGHNLPEFLGSFAYLVLAVIFLFVLDWKMALAAICVLPPGIFIQMRTMKRNRDLRDAYFCANEKTNAAMIQYIQGMPVIKAFNRTGKSFEAFGESTLECARLEDLFCRKWFLPFTLTTLSTTANILVLVPLGVFFYLSGSIGLGTLVLFLLIGLGLGAALLQFVNLGSFMEKHLERQIRIQAIFDADSLPEPENSAEIADEGLSCREVSFDYGGKNVLEDIRFTLAPRHFLALAGPSGAGKTTLARLIARFHDVKTGAIRLGGTDIRDMKTADLLDHITFVFQDVFLFNDTIFENIAMGKPGASVAEVEAAAKAASCHDFIMALPEGYNHKVGERGMRLSGGEKQRISIARALLKNAPVLVMDEATAFMDPENEALIQKALNALVRDKTLVVIAHRLSTIRRAGEILVLDQGKILARGNHESLLQQCELYRRMWETQTRERTWTLSAGKGGRLCSA